MDSLSDTGALLLKLVGYENFNRVDGVPSYPQQGQTAILESLTGKRMETRASCKTISSKQKEKEKRRKICIAG